ncbi:Vitamin B12-dependent ribonucleotide reductase [Candidatus Entotheonellaceae bacterium PAL068K]
MTQPITAAQPGGASNGQPVESQCRPPAGLADRYFTRAGISPLDEVEWETRHARIVGLDGAVVFDQPGVEFPRFWSQMATQVVASKYFRGPLGTEQRETSVRQLIGRVVRTLAHWGQGDGYFQTDDEALIFEAELTHLLLYQKAAFNSPVWFNCGVEPAPQCSACFINSVDDTMESILDLARIEGMLFKWGSGSGANLSPLRSSREGLSGGGTASGPVSFMKGYDAFAGAIKSGGKTRRAAKMVILDISHPDIRQFISCKAEEEKKAQALIAAGYDGSLDGEAYASVFFQNANNAVRVSDAFMQAVVADGEWATRLITTGEVSETYRARDLLRLIAEAAHACGDPGLQFDTTINDWHTCPHTDRIRASNPCSEYMFLDNTACNLASLNLLRFAGPNPGGFDIEAFRRAVHTLILAQDIIVGGARYPTPAIRQRSRAYRPLGLGYTNLGAFLMAGGLAYDSDAARATARAITALMTGQSYLTSARIAALKGPFEGYAGNREPMLRVIRKHQQAASNGLPGHVQAHRVQQAAVRVWDEATQAGLQHGFRNSQVTVLAPTGTISFMMDCDTTGIEPELALIKYKQLSGGGLIKQVNATVPLALDRLGYTEAQRTEIVRHLGEHSSLEGAPFLRSTDLPVFDCALPPPSGSGRAIPYMAHIRMMAAVQPFLSGAISKTVNLPEAGSVEDIEQAYIAAWRMGCKAITVYRDGSRRTQPLSTLHPLDADPTAARVSTEGLTGRRLPDERPAITHRFQVAGFEGSITVGLFDDGTPGELRLLMAKEGSTLGGLMNAFGTAISMALQAGVPLERLVTTFSHMRFDPAGFTRNPEIPMATSVIDYIFRWLASKFLALPDEVLTAVQPLAARDGEAGMRLPGQIAAGAVGGAALPPASPFRTPYRGTHARQDDALPCSECGALMMRRGGCYTCPGCGASSACG